MPHYKLIYFNFYGRAETIRFLFHLAGVPYEEVDIDIPDWSSKKSETRWGFLPELEVDGKKLAQSNAINFYLAKQFGFIGQDDWEAARILEFLTGWEDLFPKFIAAFFEQNTEKKTELEKTAIESAMKPFYQNLERCLDENGAGYLVGDKLTVADINAMVNLTGFEEVAPGVLGVFPKLVAYNKRIQDEPKIKEWIDKRPKIPFSIMSKKK
uniref:Uncharacterized protein n=1 Tax=Plectus sambesii TaxID=2011161 RepID=A0A914W3X4_9BILA